jgi:hypothetical protein
MKNLLLVSVNILLQLILTKNVFAYSINEWIPYLSCNNGAAVVDYKTIQTSRSEQEILQVVVRDHGVVNYFKGNLSNIYKFNEAYQRRYNVYNEKDEAIFPATSDYNGNSWQNRKQFGQRSLYSRLETDSHGQVDFIAERIGSGLKIQLLNHTNHKELANWYFEYCTRVNLQSAFDPLDYYYSN